MVLDMEEVCLVCGKPATFWSIKKNETDKRHWCSHTCKLLGQMNDPIDTDRESFIEATKRVMKKHRNLLKRLKD